MKSFITQLHPRPSQIHNHNNDNKPKNKIMKTLKILFIAAFVLVGATTMAQNLKLAYLNSNEIMAALPEMEEFQKKAQAYRQEMLDQLEEMQVEYSNKMNDYKNKFEGWSDAVRQQKLKEVQDLQSRIEAFAQDAEQDVAKKNQEWIKPIVDKVQNAIKEVGKEHGFTYIFDTVQGSIVYMDEATATNAGPLVKGKLGVK
ncbi:Outer membrane protein H precursor [Mucinivorans hirudinis]|uniref:Outer membrane protein H n=1 Tax=Mucinivorans hirudinis TaxID=1433126 RepID=A0A060RDV6_9BACT|nr:Outer membrane protein H precursor [Mucinivorans hirudinis]